MDRKPAFRPKPDPNALALGAWRAEDAAGVANENERRATRRYPVQSQAGAEPVRLVDLSLHGCCVGFARKVGYRPGQFIRLGFPGEREGVRAIVRWVEGSRIGVEFTHGLTSARMEAILMRDRNPVVIAL